VVVLFWDQVVMPEPRYLAGLSTDSYHDVPGVQDAASVERTICYVTN
jgi:hypothetical protein